MNEDTLSPCLIPLRRSTLPISRILLHFRGNGMVDPAFELQRSPPLLVADLLKDTASDSEIAFEEPSHFDKVRAPVWFLRHRLSASLLSLTAPKFLLRAVPRQSWSGSLIQTPWASLFSENRNIPSLSCA